MKKIIGVAVFLSICLMTGPKGFAGVKYQDGDKFVEVGGRIQLQYHSESVKDGVNTDEVLLRSFRPNILGGLHKDWRGRFEWEMGKNNFEVKNVYIEYLGFKSMGVILGNCNFPFSRELLTTARERITVERTFAGDHNYGTPDKQTGVHLNGEFREKMFGWGFAVAKGALDPDNKKLDFEPVIQVGAEEDLSDWSEGNMVGARFDFFPKGYFKFSQCDFEGEPKLALGVGAFLWKNDENNLDPSRTKNDVDEVHGFEISGALRGKGFTIDCQYNIFDSELVDDGITSGLYQNSETLLEDFAVEGGYLIKPLMVEVVMAYEIQNADNYDKYWTRFSGGINYYIEKHDIKLLTTYRIGENKDGVDGYDVDELFVQAQYVF